MMRLKGGKLTNTIDSASDYMKEAADHQQVDVTGVVNY